MALTVEINRVCVTRCAGPNFTRRIELVVVDDDQAATALRRLSASDAEEIARALQEAAFWARWARNPDPTASDE